MGLTAGTYTVEGHEDVQDAAFLAAQKKYSEKLDLHHQKLSLFHTKLDTMLENRKKSTALEETHHSKLDEILAEDKTTNELTERICLAEECLFKCCKNSGTDELLEAAMTTPDDPKLKWRELQNLRTKKGLT